MTDQRQLITEQELQALCAAATPEPWERTSSGVILGPASSTHGLAQWVVKLTDLIYDADAEFIAAARTAVPQLLAEVARLRGVVQAVEALHRPMRMMSEMGGAMLCEECVVPFPCSTAAAAVAAVAAAEGLPGASRPTSGMARVLAKHQLADVLPGGVACTCGADLAALNPPLDDGSIKGEPLALAVHQLQEMDLRARIVAAAEGLPVPTDTEEHGAAAMGRAIAEAEDRDVRRLLGITDEDTR